jgi:hypothetical protein
MISARPIIIPCGNVPTRFGIICANSSEVIEIASLPSPYTDWHFEQRNATSGSAVSGDRSAGFP